MLGQNRGLASTAGTLLTSGIWRPEHVRSRPDSRAGVQNLESGLRRVQRDPIASARSGDEKSNTSDETTFPEMARPAPQTEEERKEDDDEIRASAWERDRSHREARERRPSVAARRRKRKEDLDKIAEEESRRKRREDLDRIAEEVAADKERRERREAKEALAQVNREAEAEKEEALSDAGSFDGVTGLGDAPTTPRGTGSNSVPLTRVREFVAKPAAKLRPRMRLKPRPTFTFAA